MIFHKKKTEKNSVSDQTWYDPPPLINFSIFFKSLDILQGDEFVGEATANRECVSSVLRSAVSLMSDGNLDTRSSAKKIFRTLVSHERFDSLIVYHYLADIYRDSIDKLDTTMKQINLMK